MNFSYLPWNAIYLTKQFDKVLGKSDRLFSLGEGMPGWRTSMPGTGRNNKAVQAGASAGDIAAVRPAHAASDRVSG
jgi:hypothetical protein